MRMVTGAILILAAVQAYAHAYLARYPEYIDFRPKYEWLSYGLATMGAGFLIWGVLTETFNRKQ